MQYMLGCNKNYYIIKVIIDNEREVIMKTKSIVLQAVVLAIFVLAPLTSALPVTFSAPLADNTEEYPLPPPLELDMNFEETIFRRMSVREFTDEPVTDEELATVLWAAHGFSTGEKRTIAGINDVFSGIIYVLKEDAAYIYNAVNHSLIKFKDGDYRDIVGWQYEAPIQLGLCWNTTFTDADTAGAELGQIGQNIYLAANALNLGTVVCGQVPPAIDPLDIPENQKGLVVMPLGHPVHPYNFKKIPCWISWLPRIQQSTFSLHAALEERNDGTSFSGSVTREQLSHLLWASYGFSVYLDRSDQEKNPVKRHRTVPSAHAYYPMQVFTITESGIYQYQPNLLAKFINVQADIFGLPIVTFQRRITRGDYREKLAQATSQPSIATAPLLMALILDLDMTRPEGKDDLSDEMFWPFWYYEAGSSAHNIVLEATTQQLSSAIISPTDTNAIQNLLNIKEETVPLYILPVGK